LLDNRIRWAINGYINENPGHNYSTIMRALDLNNGSLAYHLKVLEREGYVKSVSYRAQKLFFPTGTKVPAERDMVILSPIQQRIVDRIKESPGLTQKALATIFGISEPAISYQIKALKNEGLVTIRQAGREKLCYPAVDPRRDV